MIEELERLNLTMVSVTVEDAKDIVQAIIQAIARLLNVHIIDVLWRERAVDGVILNPFVSHDTTARNGPRPYQIFDTIRDHPTGVWTWVYENCKPLWIERILSKDRTKPIRNEATSDDVDPRYLDFFAQTDSIMAVPLICRGNVCGIFSVESPISDRFSTEIKELLDSLSKPIASIIWKADVWKYNQDQTSEVTSHFVSSIEQTIDANLISDLRKLSLTLDFMPEEEAKKVIENLNTKLARMLGAHIVDVLWAQEGQSGIILAPFLSYDTSSRGGARPYQLIEGGDAHPTGIWTWIYKHSKPLWIEGIQSIDKAAPVQNKATGDDIEPIYLNFSMDTDSILAVPFTCRGTVRGVYSIELPDSGKLTSEIQSLIEAMSGPVSNIIWKADAQRFNQEHRSRAVQQFCDLCRNYRVEELLAKYRTGFFVRPFNGGFSIVEECARQFFEKFGIRVQHHVYEPGKATYVIDDIMDQIASAHFGIADITGCNYNVMLELGMMMILNKKIVLLQKASDDTEVPFNIGNLNLYLYDETKPGPEIRLLDPGTNEYKPLEAVLKPFIDNLENDPAFRVAKRWKR